MSAVALRQNAKSVSLPLMVAGSFFFHVAAITLFLVLPQLLPHRTPQIFGGQSGSGGLRVVGVFDLTMGQKGPAASKPAQEEPAPARYLTTKKAEEVPLESATSLPDPTKKKKKEEPAAKETLNQPLSQRKLEGPYGKGTNTKVESPKSGSAGTGKFGVGSFGAGEGGPGGYGTGTGVEFPFPWYLESIFTKIEINWGKPYIEETTPQQYISVVYFVISRTGQVSGVKIDQSSGIPALDRSAESAVLSAAPFPPLPNQWTQPDLAFRVSFYYTK